MHKVAKLLVIFMLVMQYSMYIDGPSMVRADEVEGDFHYRALNEREIEITDYVGESGSVVIPNQIAGMDVTVIGDEAFRNKGLTDVQFPETLREIGARAFADNQLESVDLPSGVEEIGADAFKNNKSADLDLIGNKELEDMDTESETDGEDDTDMGKNGWEEADAEGKTDVTSEQDDADVSTEDSDAEEAEEEKTENQNEGKKEIVEQGEIESEPPRMKMKSTATMAVSEPEYVMAGNDDFNGTKNGEFRYIGEHEYVEIPQEIDGVSVTSYKRMFSDYHGAKTSHVKGVKSTNNQVTDMSEMFKGSQATELDLSALDTSKVRNMIVMFSGSQAKDLDVSHFDTSNVINMWGMFRASQATMLDLSNFDTRNVMDMSEMFSGSQATELDLSALDTRNVTYMDEMFKGSQATVLDLGSFDLDKVANMGDMFKGSDATVGYAKNESDAQKFNDSSTNRPSGLTFRVIDKDGYVLAISDDFSGTENGKFRYIGKDEYVVIPHTIKKVEITSYEGMFSDVLGAKTSNVKGVKSTSDKVTNMSQMFRGSQATTVDLGSFDTSQVTNMSQMFWGSYTTTVDVSSFDTSEVTNMRQMFSHSQATTLDLSSFDTIQVTDMYGMFWGSRANTLDLSSFDTIQVMDMDFMFFASQATKGYAGTKADADKFNSSTTSKPSGLTFKVRDADGYVPAIDSDFDGDDNGKFRYIGNDVYVKIPHEIKGVGVTSYEGMFSDYYGAKTSHIKGVKSTNDKVTDMSEMFRNSKATTLDLSGFDTSQVTNMSSMFRNSSATTLDLSSFDTSQVTNMIEMFRESHATALDLRNFDTSQVTNMSSMFYGSQASTLDLSSFDTSQVTNMGQMFWGSQATTLDLSGFDTNRVTNMYAIFNLSEATKGYAGTQSDADRFNGSTGKPSWLTFIVRGLSNITFETNGNNDYKKSHSTKVNVELLEDEWGSLQYQWTDSEKIPTSGPWMDFGHNDTLLVEGKTGDYYLHIKSTGKWGVTTEASSNVFKLDNEEPKLTLSASTEDATNQDIVITAKASDDHSGVKRMRMVDDDWEEATEMTFPVLKNGTYTFEAEDVAGNIASKQIEITNIDKENPVVSISKDGGDFAQEHLTKVDVTDIDSGVSTIEYQWTQDKNFPTDDFKTLENGKEVTTPNQTGKHYLHVLAVDKAGNKAKFTSKAFYVDTTKPDLTLIPDKTDPTNENVTITVKATDAHSGVKRIRLKDGDWEDADEMTFPVSENGIYTFEAEDVAGNIASNQIEITNIDKENPVVSLSKNGGDFAQKHMAKVDVMDVDSGVSTIEYQWTQDKNFPTDDFKTLENGKAVTTPNQTGKHYLHVLAVDKAGNKAKYTSKAFHVDTTKPDLILTPDKTDPTNKNVTITAKATDIHSGVKRIRVADGDWKDADEMTFTATENGTYTFETEDVAGNTISKSIDITNIDQENPVVTLSKDGGDFAQGHLTKVEVTDVGSGISTIEYQWTQDKDFPTGDFKTLGNGKEVTTPNQTGKHYLHVLAVDKAGNKEEFTSKAFYVDTTKPDLTLTPNKTDPTNKKVTITAKATDVHSGVKRIRVADVDWKDADEMTFTATENGTYTFETEDLAGNKISKTIDITNIDQENPVVSLSKNGGDFAQKHMAKVDVMDVDSGVSTIEYQWTQDKNFPTDDFKTLENGKEVTTLNQTGKHYLHVLAVDKAGNKAEFTSKAFHIDTTKPDLVLTPDKTDPTNKNVTITAKSSDTHSGVKRIRVADGDWKDADEMTLKVSKNGTYTFEAEDVAGNITSKSVKVTNIDKVAPTLTLLGDETMELIFGETYEEAGFEVSDDQDKDIEKKVKINGEVDTKQVGTYEITYTATDHAGNQTIKKRIIHVVDKEKPVITLIGAEHITLEIGERYEELGATAIDNVDGDMTEFVEVTGEVDTSKQGKYELYYNVTDKAGNEAIAVMREIHIVAPSLIELVLDSPPVAVYADAAVKVKDTNVHLQLPNDLPEGTLLQVNTVKDVPLDGFEIVGEMYDFIFTFPEGQEDYTGVFTLTLGVDETKKNQAIYHYNEEAKQWESIGGEISSEGMTVTVEHFSIYGVLSELIAEPVSEKEIPVVIKDEEPRDNDDKIVSPPTIKDVGEVKTKGNLPNTGSHTFNILFIGLSILFIGITAWSFRKRLQ